jgi:glucan biosynthesis protein C
MADGRPTDGDEHQVHLDNLKIVLVAGVIVAHAAMTYGAVGTWVYEDPSLSDPMSALLGVLIGVGAMFGLGLFFLVAGMLTTPALIRHGPRRYLWSRVWRLGLPVILYAVVVWPVLRWLVERVEEGDVALSDFYRQEFSDPAWKSAGTGPMWFVAILLVVTVGWAAWRWVHPPRQGHRADQLAARHLVMTAGTVLFGTFLVRLRFPLDSPQILDLHVWFWPQAVALFVLGAVGAEGTWFRSLPDDLRRGCQLSALLAVAVLAILILLSPGPEPFRGGWHWEAAGLALCEAVFSVSMSVVVLEWFRRRHARQGALGRMLAPAAYGAFVLQGPVLVLLALALRPSGLWGDVQFLVLALTATVACFGLALVASRARGVGRNQGGRAAAGASRPYQG